MYILYMFLHFIKKIPAYVTKSVITFNICIYNYIVEITSTL